MSLAISASLGSSEIMASSPCRNGLNETPLIGPSQFSPSTGRLTAAQRPVATATAHREITRFDRRMGVPKRRQNWAGGQGGQGGQGGPEGRRVNRRAVFRSRLAQLSSRGG